jgi:hypothetical protein
VGALRSHRAGGVRHRGQSLARQTYLDSADLPALWALGFSRAQLVSLGILRAGAIGVAAACVVVPVAVLLSPLAPVGLARIAEPDPGFAVDALPLVLGAVLVALLTMLASAVPAWTAARTAATVRREGPGPGRARSSAFTSALSRAWRSPAAATGIRMALQPGRGRTAVPVRSAIFGATLSIAALTASLVFAASLGHLLTTPGLSGFTWDAFASLEGGLPRAAAALRADPSIAGYTRGGFAGVRIGQLRLMAFGTGPAGDHGRGCAGRRRRGCARRLDHARCPHRDRANRGPDARPGRRAPETGPHAGRGNSDRAPHPIPRDQARGGSRPCAARLCPDRSGRRPAAGRAAVPGALRPGVSRDAGLAAVTKDITGLPGPYITAAERPANVVSLASIVGLPVALSGLLALIAAGTLAHTLASSTRRRRRDLAILKSLGFTRRQVRHAVGWQATTIAGIALLIGLPAGIAGGRWAWRVFAAQLGVLPEPAVPLTTVFIAIPAALALAKLIAAAPGRAAARTQPGAVLRTE